MKRILLLVNPHARSGSGAFQQISEALEEAGHHIINTIPDKDQENFRNIICQHAHDTDLVIIGGGDGTINTILPALIESKLPMLIFPLGTANLLARSFDLKPDIPELLKIIDEGVCVDIDLGSVNGIPFINVCGIGISTEVNKNVSKTLKKFTGPLSFWLTGLKLIKRMRPYKLKITLDDSPPIITKTWQVTVCNGRKYGAWMTIAPEAAYDDGLLHCLSTEVKKTWEGLKLLPSYVKGTYKEHHEVNFLKGKKIKIESKRPLQIDVDGDVQTRTPAEFKVLPKALKLYIPKECLHDESPVSASSAS